MTFPMIRWPQLKELTTDINLEPIMSRLFPQTFTFQAPPLGISMAPIVSGLPGIPRGAERRASAVRPRRVSDLAAVAARVDGRDAARHLVAQTTVLQG
eukprot:s466_g9.t1